MDSVWTLEGSSGKRRGADERKKARLKGNQSIMRYIRASLGLSESDLSLLLDHGQV